MRPKINLILISLPLLQYERWHIDSCSTPPMSKPSKKHQRQAAGRFENEQRYETNSSGPKVVTLDAEAKARQTKRHLDELEKDNYMPTTELDSTNISTLLGKKDTASSAAGKAGIAHCPQLTLIGSSKKRRKSNQNVRRLLFTRKNLNVLLEESKIELLPASTPTYLTAQIGPSRYPPRQFCSICGYWGNYTCLRCGMRYCSLTCRGTHLETRCMKYIA